jgi:Domain of unknown function (DUF4124)
VLATLAAFAGQAAVVYKWTDADGVVHYSDHSVPGAEKIFTAASPTPGGAASPAGLDQRAPGPKKPAANGLDYTEFSITSPARDQTFFGDDIISVHLALNPGLKADQTITWHLNGKQLSEQEPTATQFALQKLSRGAYAIAATITDQQTGESQSTDSVSFFVREPSELEPQRKKP